MNFKEISSFISIFLRLQIDDKDRDLQMHADRIADLEQCLQKRHSEQNDLEKRLRRDLETLQSRNAELETKLVEAASMVSKNLNIYTFRVKIISEH